MRFITITIFAVASRLVTLATAKPVPNWKSGGMAVTLTKHSQLPNSNKSIKLRDAITSHGRSVEEKILKGLDNYEMNTGTMHPFAVNLSESRLKERDGGVPLTRYWDEIWQGEILIGTPPKTLNVFIDTGVADLWVLETGCLGISGIRDLWDPHSSESAKHQDMPFELRYPDGLTVTGDRYTDSVTIAGFTADSQTFGSVIRYTSPYEYGADGLLGLANPSVSSFRANPLIVSLVEQNKLIHPIISFKLSSSGAGAEMYVGGLNSMLYSGDITYTRVTNRGFWQVSMDDLRVNGHKVLENVPVIFDTGANHIYGDWNQVSELYRGLGGTLDEYEGYGYYFLPCDSFPTVSVTFGGRTFEIPPQEFKVLETNAEGNIHCFGAIVARRSPLPFWTIGLPFLQGVYSVFDYGTSQVGFADLVRLESKL